MNAAPVDEATHQRLAQLKQRAVEALEQACAMKPAETKHEVDVAEVALLQLRDALIVQHRASQATQAAQRWRPTLDQVNAVLSLVVGLEYPAGGIQAKTIANALTALKAIQL